MSTPRDDRHRCDTCGGPNAIFIEGDANVCRWCTTINPAHRNALNVLRHYGLIFPKETP
jgi:hypothetical protein